MVDGDQAVRESENVRGLLQEDGMERWAPNLGADAPCHAANASMVELLAEVPTGGTAWLAFGNSGVTEMLFNWVHHVVALGKSHSLLVAAFDDDLFRSLRAKRIPAYNYSGALPPTHFRHAPYLFHRMGFLKAELIRLVLQTGRHVLVSDSDVVWMRDPAAEIAELAALGATLGAATDCLDVDADRDKTERPEAPVMCGHAPGNKDGAVFNTGVLWFAADPSSIAFAQRWATATLTLASAWDDDQGAFNRLAKEGFYPVRRHSADGRVVVGPKGVRIAPLPSDRFCSGHLVWTQQAAQTRACVSVHATFTEYGDAGKRWRFLEAGLWALNAPEYFTEGRYLTFVPPKPPPDPQPCPAGAGAYVPGGPAPKPCAGEDPHHGLGKKRFGNIMWQEGLKRSTRLRANSDLMARQVHAFRDAAALARVLNRTLIVPHFDCLCDRSEDVEIIPSCVYHGAPPSLPMPFKCSLHFVLDTHKLQMMSSAPTRYGMRASKFNGYATPPLKLRAHSFLDDARTAADIKASVVDVAVAPAGGGDGAAAALRRGATSVEALKSLERWKDARVLRLADAEGVFSGWVGDAQTARMFQTMMDYYVLRGAWCCTSRGGNQDDGRVYTKAPPPLRLG